LIICQILFSFYLKYNSAIKYYLIDTFSGDIELQNPSRNILTAAFKNTKPYKMVVGSEDNTILIHEGPPFKFQALKKEHSNFVSCIKFNPDYTQFASVGFDKKINIWDAVNNTVLYTIDSSNSEMHAGSIIYLVWLDHNTIATISVDKVVKIWDLESKSIKYNLYPVEKSILGESQIGCGLAYSASMNYLILVTLDGKLNIWYTNLFADGKLPDLVIHGHQSSITHVRYSKSIDKLISLDNQGKISNRKFNFVIINILKLL